jgi:crossover junction endodeoxyribonuclease RuvC
VPDATGLRLGSNGGMRVLGIDPGLRTTGFGVVDCDGGRLRYVASGTIRTAAVALPDLPGRLKVIFDGVREIAARYAPTCASVEIVFVNVNPQATLLLGQARGAAHLRALQERSNLLIVRIRRRPGRPPGGGPQATIGAP